MHGLMGYGMNWRRIVTALKPTEQILTFDQRGHGKSWKPQTGYAAEDYAEDLYLITEELGWEHFILVGHSMGGRNALEFASRFPEKVDRLIIEDIGPDSDSSAPDFYRWLFGVIPTPFDNKLKAKEFFLNEFKIRVRDRVDSPDTLGLYLYSNINELPDGKADWRFSPDAMISTVSQGIAKDRWDQIRALSMPTLLIRGEKSKLLSREVFERVLMQNPKVEGVEISNAGHWVHSDQPEEFLGVIRKFTGLPS